MTSEDGGRAAARGLQFQYLRTLEALLRSLDDSRVTSCRVEGEVTVSRDSDVDAVDYDLLAGSERLVASQVKSRGPGRSMSGPESFAILRRLISTGPAAAYEIITNAEPTNSLIDLQETVKEATSNEHLRDRLRSVLRHSNVQLEQLARMGDRELTELRRSRISIDSRPTEELREDVGRLLVAHRRRSHQSIGARSNGLLTGYLLSEVMRRAADAQSADWSVADLRRQAELDDDALVRALGYRDFGSIVGSSLPPSPDVRRPDLMQSIYERLQGPASEPAALRRVLLTGLSGIGKSSLACTFVAENADRYDLTMWIDASSPESLASSFRRVLSYLQQRRGAPQLEGAAPASEVLGEVAWRLRESDLAWLAIYDDADDPATIAVPVLTLGTGDVIITTTNAAARYGEQVRIDVSSMTPPEASELAGRRLAVHQHAGEVDMQALQQLTADLAYSPLAIELAVGYIVTSELPIAELPRYTELLKSRALDDRLSIPLGYPRTVVAAVQLALERIEESVQDDATLRMLVDRALGALAYLAPRRIPLYLLAAISTVVDSADQHRGPYLPDPDLIPVVELGRALRRASLVRLDEPLPAGDPETSLDLPGADSTVAVNALLQEVMRQRLDTHPNLPELLGALIDHTERWLTASFLLGENWRTWTLLPQADTLLSECRRLGLMTKATALLMGNVAAIYAAHAAHDRAQSLLEEERRVALALGPDADFLVTQILLALAVNTIHDPEADVEREKLALARLEELYFRVQQLVLDPSTWVAAADILAPLVLELEQWDIDETLRTRLVPMTDALRELATRVPPTETVTASQAVAAVSAELSAGATEETVDRCRTLTTANTHAVVRFEARRLLVEALAQLGRWQDARDEFGLASREVSVPPVYVASARHLVLNTGLAAAFMWLGQRDVEALELLRDIVAGPLHRWMSDHSSAADTHRFDLLATAGTVKGPSPERSLVILQDAASRMSVVQASANEDNAWALVEALVAAGETMQADDDAN